MLINILMLTFAHICALSYIGTRTLYALAYGQVMLKALVPTRLAKLKGLVFSLVTTFVTTGNINNLRPVCWTKPELLKVVQIDP